MTKPDDVSQEAWGAAEECWQTLAVSGETRHEETAIIARAIMAAKAEERERCAGLAENLHLECTDDHGDLYDGDVAEAIRKSGESD